MCLTVPNLFPTLYFHLVKLEFQQFEETEAGGHHAQSQEFALPGTLSQSTEPNLACKM